MSRPLGPDRERLLDAAETLFAAHGYDGVSLRAVSVAANSNQSLLHYHYKGKFDLYKAVWDRWDDLPRPLNLSERRTSSKSRQDLVRDAVEDFFSGPKYLSSTDNGLRFLKIIVREFADPKARDRGLLNAFIGPDRIAFINRLSADPLNIEPKTASVFFKILGATVQLMINPDQLSDYNDSPYDFSILIEFATSGISAFLQSH